MGFRWKKTSDNRKALVESYDIRLKRIEFVRKITQYRQEGRTIVYEDETYIHSSHTQSKDWVDDKNLSLKKPISKGQRLIIVHAGYESGFIENGLLIFKSESKSGDYHNDMNSANFEKWIRNQLLPNLPPRSVLVLDNASYHNVRNTKDPISASRKADMIAFLRQNKIPHNPQETKPELYNLVKLYKTKSPDYRFDKLLKEHGHDILRLPPYSPEFNPIENIWGVVKNWVATNNTTFKLNDVERLVRKKIAELSPEIWRKTCEKVLKIETDFIQKQHVFDAALESLSFTVHTGSLDEDCDSSDDDSV
ncbi:hypothetical protein Zmor_013562 [Zophobas morio]|uniref:Tc1-like transposase DDE domain-containing protein n=1 Tax=Zophobas morio TaxID=2755281 RepID=A0AA38IE76_9CUCU|nr:hypothetical protein Zmor_013562 [Zophobas morio]